MLFLSSADLFQNELFLKILSVIPSDFQTVWIQIRPNFLLGLILVQTVCRSYQQTTLLVKELINGVIENIVPFSLGPKKWLIQDNFIMFQFV